MAKRDYNSAGYYEPSPANRRREYLEYSFNSIDRDLKEKTPVKLGVKQTIINAYKENGKNGAMLALTILNKKLAQKLFHGNRYLYGLMNMKEIIKEMIEMIDKIKEKALAEHIPIIMDDTLEVIAKYLEEIKPKRILEIGTAVGYSAICFSKYLSNEGRIDTIERDEERIKEAKENIKQMNLEKKIHLYEGDAVEILPSLNEKYNVVFIDAAKGKYPFFLSQAIRLLDENGVIIADNILYKGYVMSDYNKHKQRTAVRNLREYIKETTENPNFITEILEVGDGLAISKKK